MFSDAALKETTHNWLQVESTLEKQYRDKEDLRQALWQYGRQFNFLFHLALAPISHWEQERHRKNLLFSKVSWLLPKTVKLGKSPEFEQVRNRCQMSIQGLHKASDLISAVYFDGIPLLLKEHTVRDAELLIHLDKALVFYRDGLEWEHYKQGVTEEIRTENPSNTVDEQSIMAYANTLMEAFIIEAKMIVWSYEGKHQKVNEAFRSCYIPKTSNV